MHGGGGARQRTRRRHRLGLRKLKPLNVFNEMAIDVKLSRTIIMFTMIIVVMVTMCRM